MNRRAAILILLSAAAGCTPMRMTVPAELSAVPEWPVQGRSGWRIGQQLHFGEYQVHDVSRGGTRSRGGIADALRGKTELQQRYGFRLRLASESEDRWTGRCDSRDIEQGVELGSVELSLDEAATLECSLRPADGAGEGWTLRVGARGDEGPAGVVEHGRVRYDLQGERMDPMEPPSRVAGFAIRRDGRFVGAVETVNGGSVRIVPGLQPEEQHLLAAVAAALLLRDQLITDD